MGPCPYCLQLHRYPPPPPTLQHELVLPLLRAPPVTRSLWPARPKMVKRKAPSSCTQAPDTNQEPSTVSATLDHRVAIPLNYVQPQKDPRLYGTLENPAYHGTMAKTYSFKLDHFQQLSVACLERQESLLVAAHTSAGKTAVAEYAIAMSFRDRQRVIYTSPIKALSNQKFKDLKDKFTDVGILTGDLTLSPAAGCLVVTTEVLRGMLYRGSPAIKEVGWVIFDEIHYMKDKERGVVWEESIIFLPAGIKMVFLSATLSNAFQFAQWVCSLRQQPCHVVFTDSRPVPLRHYIFRGGGAGVHLVADEKGRFREEKFAELQWQGGGKRDGGRRETKGADLLRIVKMIIEKKLHPVIIFSFSRLECEKYASVLSKLDFNVKEEMEVVESVFQNAILCLSQEDKSLPAVELMLPLLRRGIAIHHSGLLPIIKELVELLVQEGLVKVLLATETFAIGLDMPTKTVIFTEVCKWDGDRHRWMSADEYIQMSGRAGRRGKDDCGNCIVMIDEQMDMGTCKKIIIGRHTPLISTFNLSYYMLLNIMRRAEGQPDVEYVIKNSLIQFQHDQELVEIQEKISKLEKDLSMLEVAKDASLIEYYNSKLNIFDLEKRLMYEIIQSVRGLSVLVPGRLVKIRHARDEWGWGVVVNLVKKPSVAQGRLCTSSQSSVYSVNILLQCASDGPHSLRRPCHLGEKGEMHLISVDLPLICAVSAITVSVPSNICPADARKTVLMKVQEQEKQCSGGLCKLDPVKDIGIDDPKLLKIASQLQEDKEAITAHPLYQLEEDEEKCQAFKIKEELHYEAQCLRMKINNSPLQIFRYELRNRLKALTQLGHIDADGEMQLKGQVACMIDMGDELLVTELMFNGFFHKLDHNQIAAVASCFILGEKSSRKKDLRSDLALPLLEMLSYARKVGKVQCESNLDIDVDKYAESVIHPYLMEGIYCWCQGARFSEICAMTDIFEGSIVRITRRLVEFLNQLGDVACLIGDIELEKKFKMASQILQRGIIFANSLYL